MAPCLAAPGLEQLRQRGALLGRGQRREGRAGALRCRGDVAALHGDGVAARAAVAPGGAKRRRLPKVPARKTVQFTSGKHTNALGALYQQNLQK